MNNSNDSFERMIGEMNISDMASSLRVGEFGRLTWEFFDERVVNSLEAFIVALLVSICSIEDPLLDGETVERRKESILAGATVIINRVGDITQLTRCRRLCAWLELIDFFHSMIPEQVTPRRDISFNEDDYTDEKSFLEKLITNDRLGGNTEFALLSSLGYLYCFCTSESSIRKRMNAIVELTPQLRAKVEKSFAIYKRTKR